MANNEYPIKFKVDLAKEYLNRETTLREFIKEHKISESSILKWKFIYEKHGTEGFEARKVRKNQTYSADFKIKVIGDKIKNKMGLGETARKYDIGNLDSIRKWEKLYRLNGPEVLHIKTKGVKINLNVERTSECKDLEKENKQLKMENEYLKKLNALVWSQQDKKFV